MNHHGSFNIQLHHSSVLSVCVTDACSLSFGETDEANSCSGVLRFVFTPLLIVYTSTLGSTKFTNWVTLTQRCNHAHNFKPLIFLLLLYTPPFILIQIALRLPTQTSKMHPETSVLTQLGANNPPKCVSRPSSPTQTRPKCLSMVSPLRGRRTFMVK